MSKALISRKAPYELVKEAVLHKYILNRDEKAGARLPSDRALALEFHVNIATVAKGLTALAMEGLVERKVGSGTYIKVIVPTQQLVGVFLGAPSLSYTRPEMVFYAKLDQLLQQTLHNREGNFHHYADSRIQEYWNTPLAPLLADAEAGKLSDLIVVRANPSNYPWLQQLPVNVIGYGVDYGRGSVDLDLETFSRQSVEYLVKAGCRNIGLITKLPPKESNRALSRFSLHEAFHASLHEHSLVSRPEWVQVDDFDNTLTDTEPMNSETFGYTAFQEIWNSSERPDGLVIHFDIVGLGVIRAARSLGVDLRRDVKTVFSANLGCDWPPLEDQVRMAFPIKESVNALLRLMGDSKPAKNFVRPVLVEPSTALSGIGATAH